MEGEKSLHIMHSSTYLRRHFQTIFDQHSQKGHIYLLGLYLFSQLLYVSVPDWAAVCFT